MESKTSRPILITRAAAVVVVGIVVLELALLRGAASQPSPFAAFLGRFHALAVHLPIGVLLWLAFAEVLTWSPRLRDRIDPLTGILLSALLTTAIAAFTLGLLLARSDGYSGALVSQHRALMAATVIAIACCVLVWSIQSPDRVGPRRTLYRLMLALTVGLLSGGAHFGGSLTHGETYLTKYAPGFVKKMMTASPDPTPSSRPESTPSSDPLIYADVIAPMLRERCVECHGPETAKSGLRLDTLQAMKTGGRGGPALIAGDAAHSPLTDRVSMDAQADDRMPPAPRPPLTAGEIALLRWWVDRGAREDAHVRDALVPEAARTLLEQSVEPTKPSTPKAPTPDAAPTSMTAPAPAPSAGASIEPGQALLYRDVVAPLLGARCGRCHGAAKQKGRLRVDSLEALRAGGKGGPAIVTPTGGTLLARVRAPRSADEHMPPADEPQLTSAQVALLAFWIESGASTTALASSAPAALVASARGLGASRTSPARVPAEPPSSSPIEPATSRAPTTAGEVDLYGGIVRPILERACAKCHRGADANGSFDLDDDASLAAISAKGKSLLLDRLTLPLSDTDHMPPKKEAQLKPGELAVIKRWIDAGARRDGSVARADLPPDMVASVEPAAPSEPTTQPQSAPEPKPPPVVTAAQVHGGGCAACALGAPAKTSRDLVAGLLASVGSAVWLARRRRRPMT